MFMLVGVMNAVAGLVYYRPGGWRWVAAWEIFAQKNNAYCGCESVARCKCRR